MDNAVNARNGLNGCTHSVIDGFWFFEYAITIPPMYRYNSPFRWIHYLSGETVRTELDQSFQAPVLSCLKTCKTSIALS